ncbi:MAG: hypothetical protein CENE_03448 [Candidatus Celerinatantimonas neptuna]|nr:MAG: hypothetical protein CENE_03448 [Candidatus Celerinatantimonas neptuna]
MSSDKSISAGGVDEKGYIINPCSLANIQSSFSSPVEQACDGLLKLFKDKIHSIYLYGSIARGDAIEGRSDLDMSVVFIEKPIFDLKPRFRILEGELLQHFPQIVKVDFDPGTLAEVLAKDSEYTWQFWLKHSCCCVWGTDLSMSIPDYHPSSQIGYMMNRELADKLAFERQQLTQKNAAVIGVKVAKQLLRTFYYLLSDHHKHWEHDPEQCARVVANFRPECASNIHKVLQIWHDPAMTEQDVHWLIDVFGEQVCRELETVAQKYGFYS